MMEDTDLEADVRAAIEGTSPEPLVAPEPIQEAAPEVITDDAGRVRRPDGKFAAKAQDAVDGTTNQGQIQPAPVVEPATAIVPPHSLKAAAKAVFATLPKEVQEEFFRIEGEAQKAKAEWSSKGEQYNRLNALFEPIKDRLTLSGLTQESYVSALIRADQMLRDNPGQALPELARMYGFQIPGLQAPEQPYVDPAVQELRQTVSQLQQALQSRSTEEEQGRMQEATSELEAFRNDPKHLYFDNVRPLMATFMRDGHAANLEEAYDMAVQANPQIRTLVAAGTQPKAAPAKPKDISVTGAPGQARASPKANSNSHEDDVRAAIEELTGRI
jgi:hypothetical protein